VRSRFCHRLAGPEVTLTESLFGGTQTGNKQYLLAGKMLLIVIEPEPDSASPSLRLFEQQNLKSKLYLIVTINNGIGQETCIQILACFMACED